MNINHKLGQAYKKYRTKVQMKHKKTTLPYYKKNYGKNDYNATTLHPFPEVAIDVE